MKKISNHQRGSSHIIAILIVLVVAIVGVVALRVSNAYVWPRSRTRTTFPTQSTYPTGSYTNTGANTTCSVNGSPGTTVNGICRASSPSTPGVSNSTTTTTTSTSSNGANGTSTCTVNGQVIPC